MPKDPCDILPHLRRALKERWPAVKFSVGDVTDVCFGFQSMQFDGMDDGYHSTGLELPEGTHGMCGMGVNRHLSAAFVSRIVQEAVRRHPELEPYLTPERIEKNDPDWPRRAGGGYAHPYAIIRTLAEDRTATLWHLLPAQQTA